MKLYLIEDDGYEVLTENELRERCENYATEEDFDYKPVPELSDKEAVKDWQDGWSNARDEHFKEHGQDYSDLSGIELVEEYQSLSNRPYAEELEVSNYGYIKTSKGYVVQRYIAEDVETFKTREEADKFLETLDGLMNKE